MSTNWVSIIENTLNKKMQQCKVDTFTNGSNYFSHLANSINNCNGDNAFIYISGWMLEVEFSLLDSKKFKKIENYLSKNIIPDSLLDLLIKADKRGVQIRVLLWENPMYFRTNNNAINRINKFCSNAFAALDGYTYSPIQANKALKFFKSKLPPGKFLLDFKNGFIQRSFFPKAPDDNLMPIHKLLNINNVTSHHEKVILINGEKGLKAYCGGMDINHNRFFEQHDVHCCVEDYAAHEIYEKFIRRWTNFSEYLYNEKRQLIPSTYFVNKTYTTFKNDFPLLQTIGTYTNPKSPNTGQDRSAQHVILNVIKNAKASVYIEDQYMISACIAKALHDALKRGLKQVILLTSHSDNSKDIIIQNRKRQEFYQTVRFGKFFADEAMHKSKGIPNYSKKVRFYQIEKPSVKGLWAEIVHSKLYIVDEEVLIIGSFNCSHRSMVSDSETGVVIVDNKRTLINDFKKKLFARYYSFYGYVTESVEKQMENPLDWHYKTNMVNHLNFYNSDMDHDITKKIYEHLSVVRGRINNPQNLIEKLSPIERYTAGNYYTSKLIGVADLVSSKKFRKLIWDIVEAY